MRRVGDLARRRRVLGVQVYRLSPGRDEARERGAEGAGADDGRPGVRVMTLRRRQRLGRDVRRAVLVVEEEPQVVRDQLVALALDDGRVW